MNWSLKIQRALRKSTPTLPLGCRNATTAEHTALWEQLRKYNEPIKQDKELKKISDLDIMKIKQKKKRRSKLWESEQHIQQSTRAK